MRLLRASLALVGGACALAACGDATIDDERGERFIRGVVAEQIGARVEAVTCPEDVKRKKGTTFTCAVTGADGSKGDVLVTQRDDEGASLLVNAPFLHMGEAETVMRKQIAKQAKVDDVAVACPEIVVLKKGALFRCRVTSAGRSRNVVARLTDEQGHFRYRPS